MRPSLVITRRLLLRRVPRRERRGFLLGREAGVRLLAPLLRQLVPPGERVARRLCRRAEGEAGLDGAVAADEPGVLLVAGRRHPHRHLHPRLHVLLLEEGGVDPGELGVAADALAAAVEEVAHAE